jgi:radical SAM protein with 4Fe4S-binding SPASM domain
MRPDWQHVVRLASGRFRSVRVITNGRLGESMLRRLETVPEANKLTVSVSLDGDATTHEARRGRGSFAPAAELLAAKSEIPRTVITTFGRDNLAKRAAILKLVLDWGVRFWSVQVALPAGRMVRRQFLGEDGLRELAGFVKAAQEVGRRYGLTVVADDCFGYLHPMRLTGSWHGCPAGQRLITVMADGNITGCPTMGDRAIGNIRQGGLEGIWRTRAIELKNRPASCSGCNRCPGGCQAVEKLFNRQFCF